MIKTKETIYHNLLNKFHHKPQGEYTFCFKEDYYFQVNIFVCIIY